MTDGANLAQWRSLLLKGADSSEIDNIGCRNMDIGSPTETDESLFGNDAPPTNDDNSHRNDNHFKNDNPPRNRYSVRTENPFRNGISSKNDILLRNDNPGSMRGRNSSGEKHFSLKIAASKFDSEFQHHNKTSS